MCNNKCRRACTGSAPRLVSGTLPSGCMYIDARPNTAQCCSSRAPCATHPGAQLCCYPSSVLTTACKAPSLLRTIGIICALVDRCQFQNLSKPQPAPHRSLALQLLCHGILTDGRDQCSRGGNSPCVHVSSSSTKPCLAKRSSSYKV